MGNYISRKKKVILSFQSFMPNLIYQLNLHTIITNSLWNAETAMVISMVIRYLRLYNFTEIEET